MDLNAEGRRLVAAVTGGLEPASLRVRIGPRVLHYLQWGKATEPSAMLIHGNGGHAHWWDPIVPALVPGWRLIVPDLRGHGESEWAEPPLYRIQDFSDDLLGILDLPDLRSSDLLRSEVAEPVVLIGHSMGGRVAAWLAIHHPERVRALVLLDTRLGGIEPSVAARYRGRIAGQRQGRGYSTRAEALAAFRFVPDESGVPEAIVADLAHHAVCERGPGDWTFRFDRAVLSLAGDGGGDLFGVLDRVRCPTLILNGELSWVMDTRESRAIAAKIPDCIVRSFPGAHHFLVAHPREVGRTLRDFIDGLR